MKEFLRHKIGANILRVVIVMTSCTVFFSLGFLVSRDGYQLGILKNPSSVMNAEKGKPKNVDFTNFWQVWDTVKNNYVGKIDEQKMVNGAIEGMVSSLGDPYTAYMPADVNSQFKEDMSGQFEGIGIEITQKDNKITVVAPIDGSPAQKAGLLAKDIISAVDGKSIEGMSTDNVVKKIRGKGGTVVTLSIQREGWEKAKDFKITRDMIKVKSVKWEIKNGNIGYIKVSQFGDDTFVLFDQAIRELKAKHVKRYVIDLRNNPGGLLNVAEDMISLVIKPGVVVKIKDKAGKVTEERTTREPILLDEKMVILVNAGSASASEIFAGAVQDYKRAQLVGEKTFGKGSVQQLTELPNGASVKITEAKWLTPNDRIIDHKGIEVDVKIENKDEKQDDQLNKALELVK